MPYTVRKSGSGYKVFKKGTQKSFSKKPHKTKEEAREQQKALYASEKVDEALNTKEVGSNLEFKSVIPTMDRTEASVVYKVKSEPNTNLTVVYDLGSNLEETDYKYFTIRDHNDPKGKPHKGEDPMSEESKEILATCDLSSEDLEMAGQDGYNKIEEYVFRSEKLNEPYEESLKFEALVQKILGSNEEEPKV